VSVSKIAGCRVAYTQSTAEGYNVDGHALESTANILITTNPGRVTSTTVSCTPSIAALHPYPRDYDSGSMRHPVMRRSLLLFVCCLPPYVFLGHRQDTHSAMRADLFVAGQGSACSKSSRYASAACFRINLGVD